MTEDHRVTCPSWDCRPVCKRLGASYIRFSARAAEGRGGGTKPSPTGFEALALGGHPGRTANGHHPTPPWRRPTPFGLSAYAGLQEIVTLTLSEEIGSRIGRSNRLRRHRSS